MPHFRVSDESHLHPKVVMAGDAAWGMWNRAGCFSMHYGTDGFVPEWWVKQQPQGRAKAKKLVENELWHPGGYQGDRPEFMGQKGYNFHEWRQDSYAQVEADREKSRLRKEAQRKRDSERESQDMSRRDNLRDSGGDSARTPGYTPYPLPPVVTSGGGVTSVDATGPRPHCPDHAENNDGPCRPCKRRREWDEQNAVAAQRDQLEQKRRQREIALNCPRCHGTNTYEVGPNVAKKCDPHLTAESEADHG